MDTLNAPHLLGTFLRSRRERLRPDAVGLPAGRRRRAPGLRREEVAERAGISTDWYTRIEQGRSVRPSIATVEALGRALRLSEAELAHLRMLSRSTGSASPFAREAVPEAVRRVVDGLAQPAYVTGRRWDVLAWNAAAAGLFPDLCTLADEDRNVLVYVLTNPAARTLFGDTWADEAQRMTAQFRMVYARWAGDPAFDALLERLHCDLADFACWWDTHDVREVAAGQKFLVHEGLGPLRVAYTSFQSNDDPGLRLVVFTPI